MKTIIVFGVTGGIGIYTSLHLSKNTDNNIVAVGHRKTDNGFFEQYGIKYLSVDIADYKTFYVLPKFDVDTVINMAGVLLARSYAPRMYIQSFTMGQLNVLEYMREVGCKKIISAQTPADLWYLQNTTEPMPADAQRSFPPSTDHSIYTIAKNAAIDITEYYHNTFGISRFILRFFNVYMYHPNPYYLGDAVKNGKFIGPPMVKMAKNIMAKHNQIEARKLFRISQPCRCNTHFESRKIFTIRSCNTIQSNNIYPVL